MNNISILDCTLRDGGYCNQWRFGFDNIKRIAAGLVEANVEIIECGFITNKVESDPDISKYLSFDEAKKIIPQNRLGKMFVAMINYGEYNIEDIPVCDDSSIDGVRVAFHKRDLTGALDFCKKVKEKGYKVFIQAMVSLNYSDEEFLSLIQNVNSFNPYAFYIVDSFGMMKEKDLTRLFYLVENNLNETIWIGFHSHNNMQLAYSNAQKLTMIKTNRNLIIDSSIYGMGRGAGNLNTELFVEYLNDNAGKHYQLKPILFLIDTILNQFYQNSYWGYSLPNYISASHNAHPNYASFLDDKKTLTIEAMNEIFDMMDESEKSSFNKQYIEKLYLDYMERERIQEDHKSELQDALLGRKVLLIAPGKSSINEISKIREFVSKNDPVVISINFAFQGVNPDYVFVSNMRRFDALDDTEKLKCIVTSNIISDGVFFRTDYAGLLNEEATVSDNAGLMAVKFLFTQGVKTICLAGFDGYSHDEAENYGEKEMAFITRNEVLDSMNDGMCKVLSLYSKQVEILFVTTPRFISIT